MAQLASSLLSKTPPPHPAGRPKAVRPSRAHVPPEPGASKAAALELLRRFASRSPLPLGTLRAQLIPDSSWKRSEATLGPTAAQTIARLAYAFEFALRTWQNEPDALDWLLRPHAELAGATPFALLRTESGGRSVERLMAALEFGFPA